MFLSLLPLTGYCQKSILTKKIAIPAPDYDIQGPSPADIHGSPPLNLRGGWGALFKDIFGSMSNKNFCKSQCFFIFMQRK